MYNFIFLNIQKIIYSICGTVYLIYNHIKKWNDCITYTRYSGLPMFKIIVSYSKRSLKDLSLYSLHSLLKISIRS